MTITMSSKNQVTIPKKIVEVLDLNKGAIFDIKLVNNRIHLIPMELNEKIFTAEDYQRLDKLVANEKKKGKTKKVTMKYINSLK